MKKPHSSDASVNEWQDDPLDDAVGDSSESDIDVEALVSDAPAPTRRMDGQPVGVNVRGMRQLTEQQSRFVEGVIAGLTQRQAYREAYPQSTMNDRVTSAAASKLMRHPMVIKRLQESWGETVEHLADDPVATRRYVLRQLLALSKAAESEGSKLKALELMGKSIGLWRDQQVAAPTQSAETLKRELAQHLKLLKG